MRRRRWWMVGCGRIAADSATANSCHQAKVITRCVSEEKKHGLPNHVRVPGRERWTFVQTSYLHFYKSEIKKQKNERIMSLRKRPVKLCRWMNTKRKRSHLNHIFYVDRQIHDFILRLFHWHPPNGYKVCGRIVVGEKWVCSPASTN